jgi:50S ribosomal protein L16 3-hydroxylase
MKQLNLDIDAFLKDYWQQKPLFIPNAIAQFEPPLSSDELAGLALEDEVESRLIEWRDGDWHLQHGPFQASDFVRSNPWTLLVQAVDHYVPAVAALFEQVNFIPQWRTDDVMVSYASDGGSVGPHYDNYDVFLLQGEGQRLWRIGQPCDSSSLLLPHPDLRILNNFETSEEYLLGPGDILYVPPGIAHWGIAQGECTTFSLGFRAPRLNQMLSRWTDELLQSMEPDLFYSDPARPVTMRPGELPCADLQRAGAQLRKVLDDTCASHWFGELVTEPRYELQVDANYVAQQLKRLGPGAHRVELLGGARLAWQQTPAGITVFANGDCLHHSDSVLPCLTCLCGKRALYGAALDKALLDTDTADMLRNLLKLGCIDVE